MVTSALNKSLFTICVISALLAAPHAAERRSKFCVYIDPFGFIGGKTGIQDIGFLLLKHKKILLSLGAHVSHWYYDDTHDFYYNFARNAGGADQGFHALSGHVTCEWIIPFSYFHWPLKGMFREVKNVSFSGYVLGISPGATCYMPKMEATEPDVFVSIGLPYGGLQFAIGERVLLGARIGAKFQGNLRDHAHFMKNDRKYYFASILMGVCW